MRCPDCNKFVSYDEPEVDIQSEDVIEGQINIALCINLNCAECGTQLKEANLEFEDNIKCPECGSVNLSISDVDGEGGSRMETKTAKGKQIKNPRYMKTYYTADLTIKLTCEDCGHEWEHEGQVEEQASSFEERI